VFLWVASVEILDELRRVLRSPKLHRHIVWTSEEVLDFFSVVERTTLVVRPTARLAEVRDETDNRFLEAAVASDADYIVSGDADLLDLGSFEDIAIVPPVRFLSVLTTL